MQSYKDVRPLLAIDFLGEKSLGNCYTGYYYTITSRRKLSAQKIEQLRKLHIISDGQEFAIRSECDGTEEPAGYDTLSCVNDDGSEAINKYNGTNKRIIGATSC